MSGNKSVSVVSGMFCKQKNVDTPFSLEWVFGRNVRLPLLNLTQNGKEIMFFCASGHTACMYYAEQNALVPFLSHMYEIIALEADCERRYLITSDKRKAINIWDIQNAMPKVLRTITYPFDEIGIGAAAISSDAKFLIAANDKRKCCIKIWLWSYNRDVPDGILNLPSRFGIIKRLRFCQELSLSHFFVAIFSNGICFGEWDTHLSKLKIHIPERSFMNCINDAMYIPNTRKLASITDNGQVILWSDVVPDNDETEITNNKEYVKVVKVSGVALTAIECVDGIIMIGDEIGELKFYDKDLKLLYYNSYFDVSDSQIQCISANPMTRNCKILESIDFENCPLSEKDLENEILYGPLIPRDFSTDEKPLIIRDFIITTHDGKVMAVNFMEGTMKEIFYRTMENLLTMDFHPLKNILCIFSKSGRMMQYDPDSKEQILDTKLELGIPDRLKTKDELVGSKLLNEKADKRPDSGVTENKNQYHYPVQSITCVKFAKNGIHLMIGTDRGCVYALDPDILTPYSTDPYRHSTEPITHMTFSEDSRFLIYTDATNKVILLYFGVRKWALIGKNRFHHKPMVDFVAFKMLSTDFSRILSVGEDQLLVEYDLDQSITRGRLDILSSFRYDQSSVPTSVSYIPPSLLTKLGINTLEYDSVLQITDLEMKIKLVDCNTGSILYTFLGPMFGVPITHSQFMTKNDLDLLIFGAGNKLGLYLLPIDGNPFRAIGVVASPYPLKKLCLSHDHSRCFTFGNGDQAVTMWKLHELAVTSNFLLGGSGLEPYCSLLPDGKNGYLFRELLDMFYYIQILASGINTIEERCVNEFIHVTEIVDFLRSVGFFPTDFQIKNILNEMKLRRLDNVTFEQLVILYINHKQIMGTRGHEIEKALAYFVRKFVEAEGSFRSGKQFKSISKKNIARILTEFAETVDHKQAEMCLKELWQQRDDVENEDVQELVDEEEILKRLPEKLDFIKFIENLQGICFNR